MKVAIATVQVPFIRGGAEILTESLRKEFVRRGFQADVVSIPFKWYPTETLISCMITGRMVDLTEVNGEKIDLVVAMKFPMYYVRHPQKVLWMMHQHRQAYDLWGTPFGDIHTWPDGKRLRQTIIEHDKKYLAEAERRFTISENVSKRLEKYNGLTSVPLYHPPAGYEKYYCESFDPFIFYPSRIDAMKRQRLLVEAARYVKSDAKIVIAGVGSEAETCYLRNAIQEHGLEERVQLAGFVTEEEKLAYYARCRAVFSGAFDEDYGYVPLEGFYASKPVITLADSGGALEFVEDGLNGFVTANTATAVAEAIDRLMEDRPLAERMGQAGKITLEKKNISWDYIIDSLVGRTSQK